MRLAVLLVLAALACGGSDSDGGCEHGECSYPDKDQTWCARPDKQCYYEDSPYYEP